MVKTQFWFQSWLNLWIGSGTNQIWNIQTKQPSVSNQKNTKFPWLNQRYIDEIEERTKDIPNYADRIQIQEAMYDDFYAQQVEEEKQNQRTEYKNQKKSDAINTSDKTQKQLNNVVVRTADLADLIRKKYNISLSAWTDNEVIEKFVSQINNGDELMTQYLNWENDKLLKKWGLIGGETAWQKVADFGVWFLQSPWKFGYNLIWQLIDRGAKKLSEKLEWWNIQDKVNERVRWKLQDMWYSDEEIENMINEFVEERNRDVANGTAFNGREQTDIRTPILWEERANSKATKAWELVWDIASTVALTAPASAALAPVYASASVPWALWIWALEWTVWTVASSVWTSWELPTWKELAVWAWLWAAWWALSRYLAQPKMSTNKEIRKEAEEYIQKSIKPTVKWKQNTTDFNKFIDNTMDSVDAMVKHKEALQYTDDAWNIVKWKLPTNMREFSEAIDSMKRYVYQEYDDIAKQAWDAGAQVDLKKAIEALEKLKQDKAFTTANWNIVNFIDDKIDDLTRAWTMDINEAQQLTQNLNSQLKAFFKNPNLNDVSKNAVVAEMNKWVKTAINDSIDDVLWNAIKWWSKASAEYNELKQLYGKLVSIEDEVSKRALILARNNNKWLSQTMIDSLSAWDIAEALVSLNPWKVAKWTITKVIWDIYKYLNSPDRYLWKLFNLLENPSSTSAIRKWVETVAPYAAEWIIWTMEWLEAQK